jgi:hypothetical protein
MSENTTPVKQNIQEKAFDLAMDALKGVSFEDLQILGGGLISVSITCFVFYYASTDPKSLTEKFYIYAVFGILPIIIALIFALKIFNTNVDETQFYLYSGIIFVMIVSVYLFYQVLYPTTITHLSYGLWMITVLVFIVGLAIIYRIFVRTVVNMRGWTGFFLKCLFLIPCLLIDLLESVFSELKSAPKMVVVLFILELFIILAYFYIPKIVSTQPSDSIVLLNKPTFLTSLQGIGNATQFFMDVNEQDNPSKSTNSVHKDYSISMWIYVNQHPNTYAAYSKETNIFRYGYPNRPKTGHPRLAYFNDINDANKSDKYIVYVSAEDVSGVMLDIPSQSWNQLVISYTGDSTVDIFVNGNLEKSVPLMYNSMPKYDIADIVEVGSGDNTYIHGGLHGAICNVVYHKKPLTTFQVAGDYNIYRYRNPPSNN